MEEDKKIYLIKENETIENALKLITENHRGSVIVVDDDGKLLGVVSDGDVRRGLVHGNSVRSPINKVMNINPTYLEEANRAKAEEIIAGNVSINLIPIVNDLNQVIDVEIREEVK